jgi:heme/copper-type cytochrome/quinol oxidase subunit 3
MNESKSGFRAPPRAASIGMWLFLAALGMLFLSSMLLYVLMRIHVFGHLSNDEIHMPPLAWGSTAVLLLGSFTIHQAVVAIRRERVGTCIKYLYITCGIAVLFLVLQSPCMADVLAAHRAIMEKVRNTAHPFVSIYGLVFFLIMVHALHVLGGIVALVIVTLNARRQKYDHENYMGVRFAARYWHFLDVVWIGMFTMFLVMG